MQDFGVESVRLLTNNPFKVRSLEALDVVVSDVVAHQVSHFPAWGVNAEAHQVSVWKQA